MAFTGFVKTFDTKYPIVYNGCISGNTSEHGENEMNTTKQDARELIVIGAMEDFKSGFPHAHAQMIRNLSGKGYVKNPAWAKWAAQVNVNYHDGNMPEAEAEALAGPEPKKYINQPAKRIVAVGDITGITAVDKMWGVFGDESDFIEFEAESHLGGTR